jgi:histidinol-phosphatase (PHP family)
MDAIGTIDEYCQAAIARNLTELCFTTHFDIPKSKETAIKEGCYVVIKGEKVPTSIDVMGPYVDDVCAAHERYFGFGLSVKLGVEFGYYPGCEATAQKLQERYGLDYLLCGLHTIDGEFIEHAQEHMDPKVLAEKYFADMITAAKSGVFDTIAHLDYYRKLGYDFYGDMVDTLHEPYCDDLFSALKASGTGLEVNTRAILKGLKEYYPRMEIINLARKAGVTMVRIGSDAHSPMEVAHDFEHAVNVIPPYIVDNCG